MLRGNREDSEQRKVEGEEKCSLPMAEESIASQGSNLISYQMPAMKERERERWNRPVRVSWHPLQRRSDVRNFLAILLHALPKTL
jgi:hypothetical protein